MSAPPKPHPAAIVAVAVLLGFPIPLWFVLNAMRPDLIAPMLKSQFGYLVSLAELVLTGVSVAIGVFAVAAKGEKRGVQIGLVVGSLLLCTGPAVFLVLFGPIVYAFMFSPMDA